MSILAKLRLSPKETCESNVFRTGPAGGSFTGHAEGGLCSITESKAATGIYDLKATAGGGKDYFFPWLRCGVGWVKVPVDVPDGTIVMTGGVNGCTIQVSQSGGYYYFYHDGDSKYLSGDQIQGRVLATVRPKDYDPMDMAQKMFSGRLADAARAGKKLHGDVSYGHFVFAVRKGGRFGFYSTGVMSLGGLIPIYAPITPLIVTFDAGDD